MVTLSEKPAVLALRHEAGVGVFQRFLDRGTSAWRYRAVGRYDPTTRRLTTYRDRPGRTDQRQAVAELFRLERHAGAPRLCSPESWEKLLSAPVPAQRLILYADFYRFWRINAVIVASALDDRLPDPISFSAITPALNLVAALDMRGRAAALTDRDWQRIAATIDAPGFGDDAFTNAAGACRAFADLFERLGQTLAAAEALDRSFRLAPTAGKAARLTQLYRAAGAQDRAAEVASMARGVWADDARFRETVDGA